VFLGAKSEGVHVDTGIGVAGVVLERLNNIEVSSLTLREAVLAVKLKLSGDNRVLTPAVHIKSGLRKNEGTSIRHIGTLKASSLVCTHGLVSTENVSRSSTPLDTRFLTSHGSRVLEKTSTGDESISTRGLFRTTESVDSVGKSVNSISVVERLST